jgi:hypothetical protein
MEMLGFRDSNASAALASRCCVLWVFRCPINLGFDLQKCRTGLLPTPLYATLWTSTNGGLGSLRQFGLTPLA